MKQLRSLLLLFAVPVWLSACAGTGHSARVKPLWIESPGPGVSASAGMHIRGRVAQEELAILRGREEYAKRFGVNIQSAQTYTTTVANDRTSTVGGQVTHEDTRQNDVRARVKEKWLDPDSDVLWVWLVPSEQ
jgi:hypothetical protein